MPTNIKKRMANPLLWAIALLAVAAVVLLTVLLIRLASPRLVAQNGGATITDKRSDVTYTLLPDVYSADLDTKNVYAKLDGVEYYRVIYSDKNGEAKTLDPKLMIGTVDEYGEKTLYASTELTVPALGDIEADKAIVYYIRLIEYPARAVSPTASRDIQVHFCEAESVMRPLRVNEDTMRLIYFGSEQCPYIFYVLKYYEDYSGGRYLYDSSTDKCVKLDGDTFKEVFR